MTTSDYPSYAGYALNWVMKGRLRVLCCASKCLPPLARMTLRNSEYLYSKGAHRPVPGLARLVTVPNPVRRPLSSKSHLRLRLTKQNGDRHGRGEEPSGCEVGDEEPGLDGIIPDEAPLNHLLTHKPADTDNCETCMRAKSRNVKKFVGSMNRDPTTFGDLITLDHMGMKDAWKEPGV